MAASRTLAWPRMATDAAATGLVTLVLAFPIVGLQMVGQGEVLGIAPHFGTVLWLGLAAFLGRLALGAALAIRPRRAPARALPARSRFAGWAGPVMLVAALVFPLVADNRAMDLGTTVLIYVMLGWGLNIVVGLAGLLDLGYVAFYGVGAYTVGLLATNFGLGFWTCLPVAGLFAACFGIALGFPVLRLRGDYLAIVTLGFGEIIRIVLQNWYSLTNGPNGIGGIPRPGLFGLVFAARARDDATTFADFFGLAYSPMQRLIFLYFVILAAALLVNIFTLRMRRLPIGRAWEALREDEIACRALGLNPTNVKLSAFAIGAMFAGFAGAFFAAKQGFISPESFNFSESAIILAIVVLGGMGGQLGIVMAAAVLVVTPDLLREFAQYRMMLFGAGMVALMVLRPRGLVTRRQPSVLLGDETGDALEPHAARPGVLRIEHLSMRFGGLLAIDDVSFTANSGEITAVIGPNGAGKTTLFNCLTGFYRPSGGHLALSAAGHEYSLEKMPGFRIARRAGVARTFQNIRLFAGMTVLENLMVAQHGRLMTASAFSVAGLLGLARYRRAQREALVLARYWLDVLGLAGRADDPAGSLPYGDQRRLEIGRAMCTGPTLLCLDEPAAGLNPQESADLAALLLRIRDEQRIAILLIEHDMSVVMKISDHVVVLDYGRKIADGAPAAIRSDPAVIRAYLGEDEALPA